MNTLMVFVVFAGGILFGYRLTQPPFKRTYRLNQMWIKTMACCGEVIRAPVFDDDTGRAIATLRALAADHADRCPQKKETTDDVS